MTQDKFMRAPNLEMARVLGMIDVSKVKYKYISFPSFRDVYLGGDIKTTYFHSFWVGVVMTIVNLPELIWHMIMLPIYGLGRNLFGVFTSFFLVLFFRIFAGLSGRAKGIQIDQESFKSELDAGIKKKLDHIALGIRLSGLSEQIEDAKRE